MPRNHPGIQGARISETWFLSALSPPKKLSLYRSNCYHMAGYEDQALAWVELEGLGFRVKEAGYRASCSISKSKMKAQI